MRKILTTILYCLGVISSGNSVAQMPDDAGAEILEMLRTEQPWHVVNQSLFDRLGWNVPDGGQAVRTLAEQAPGAAFDPQALAGLPADQTGYTSAWHELRYNYYGLDWDITGLLLTPQHAVEGMPTIVVLHGGSSNWYEFFVDPLNNPGLGQYLAQKVPVLLVTIPGNYRAGGWTEAVPERKPRYLLDRELSADEVKVRNASFTFQLLANGIEQLVDKVTTGPVVFIAHSTSGEIPYMLHHSALKDRMHGWILGWGSGGTSSLKAMQDRWGYSQTAADYPPVGELRTRPVEEYAGDYLGPLNPAWKEGDSREAIARRWMGELEFQRRPHFKQPLQDIERRGAVPGMSATIITQVRETLTGNTFGVDPEAVIADLFAPMRVPLTGYAKMIWTTTRLDTGHWNPENTDDATTVQVANESRRLNPDSEVRALLFDLDMTHYGHIERPKQLAAGLYTALTWLVR
jgi:hypothetical protein